MGLATTICDVAMTPEAFVCERHQENIIKIATHATANMAADNPHV